MRCDIEIFRFSPLLLGIQMQIPIVHKATKSAIENTRRELHETLEAVRQAQLQLEQLQKGDVEVGVSIVSPFLMYSWRHMCEGNIAQERESERERERQRQRARGREGERERDREREGQRERERERK